jgi:hypothetical protein
MELKTHKKKVSEKESFNYIFAEDLCKGKDLIYVPKFLSCKEGVLETAFAPGIKYDWSEHEGDEHFGGAGIPLDNIILIVRAIIDLDCLSNEDFQFRNILIEKERIAIIDWENLTLSSGNIYRNAVNIWLLMFRNPGWQRSFIDNIRGYLDCETFRQYALWQTSKFISFWQDDLEAIVFFLKEQRKLLDNKKDFRIFWFGIEKKVSTRYLKDLMI